MSRAASGICSLSFSISIIFLLTTVTKGLPGPIQIACTDWKPFSVLSGRFAQGLFALLPVARAKFVGLQGVQNPKRFINASSDRQVVNRHPSDDSFGIDDVCRPQRHAFLFVKDAQ